MRIAIVGAGGVGAYYGGRLAQAGEDVTFIARGANLAALRERGLRVSSTKGDFHLAEVRATSDPTEVGAVDLVIVAVKTYGLEGAAKSLGPLMGAETMVLPLQNGVDAAERLAAVVGRANVLKGLTYISSELVAPGEVRHVSPFTRILVGEYEGGPTERVQRVVEVLTKAGIEATVAEDIDRELWMKFMFIAVQGALTALTRSTIGPLREHAPTWRLYSAALHEIEDVARARGVSLPAEAAEGRLAWALTLPHTFGSSMAADVEHGRRLEIEDFSGAVVRMGEESDVPTPVHRTLYALLSLIDRRAAVNEYSRIHE